MFIYWLVALSVFLIPMSAIVPIPGTILWYGQFIALLTLGFLFLINIIWHTYKPLACIGLMSLFSYIFIAQTNPRALMCLVAAFSGLMLIVAVRNMKDVRHVYGAILAMAFIQGVYVVFQHFGIDPFFKKLGGPGTDVVGFVGSHNQLGIYYAGIIPFLISSPLLLPVAIIPLMLAKCSSAVIGAFAGALFYAEQTRKLVMPVAILILAFCFLPWLKNDIAPNVFKERSALLQLTTSQVLSGRLVTDDGQVIKANPLLGFGIGNFFMYSHLSQKGIIINEGQHRYEHAHNDLVEVLFDFGIIGMIVVLWTIYMFFNAFLTCVNRTRLMTISFASLLAQGIASLGVYVIHAPVSFFMFCLTTGLFLHEVNHANKRQSFS